MKQRRLVIGLVAVATAVLGLVAPASAETKPVSNLDATLLRHVAAADPNQVPLLVTPMGFTWFKLNSRAEIRRIGSLDVWRVRTRDYTARRSVAALPDGAVYPDTLRPRPISSKAVGPAAVSGTNYRSITGADVVNGSGNKGADQAVAVIDSGILATSNYFKDASLVSRIVAQGCWVYRDGSEDFPCLNGQNSDVSSNAADISGLSAARQYDYSHGSHVAGIAAGRQRAGDPVGVTDGMAPEADIIALRVFGSEGAWDSDILSALSWVKNNAATYNIASVNLSLGSYPQANCGAYYLYGQYFGELLQAGVAPVVATGNDGVKNAIGAPSCAPNAISIAATTPIDTIASFSNLAPSVDLGAPGTSILSLAPGSGSLYGAEGSFEAWNGTSMATPVAAGAFALAKAAGYDLSPTTWLGHMRDTATSISSDGAVTKRINIDDAIAAASDFLPPEPPANAVFTQDDWDSFSVTWQAPATGPTPTGYKVRRNGSVVASVSAGVFSYAGSIPAANTIVTVETVAGAQVSSVVSHTFSATSLTDPNWQLLASGSPFSVTDLMGADLCTIGGPPRIEISYYSPVQAPRDLLVYDGKGSSLVISESVDPTPAPGFSGSGYAMRILWSSNFSSLVSTAKVYVFDNLDRLSAHQSLSAAATVLSNATSSGAISPSAPTGVQAQAQRLRAAVTWNSAMDVTWRVLVDGAQVANVSNNSVNLQLEANEHDIVVCAVRTVGGRELTSPPSATVTVTPLPLLVQTLSVQFSGALVLGGTPVTATATSSADLPVTLESLTPAVCSIDESGSVTPVAPGSCEIEASSAGDSEYAPATKSVSVSVVRPAASPARNLTVSYTSGKAKFVWLAPLNASLAKLTGYQLKYRVALPGKAFGSWKTVTTTARYWLSGKYVRGTRIEVTVTALAVGGSSALVRKVAKLP